MTVEITQVDATTRLAMVQRDSLPYLKGEGGSPAYFIDSDGYLWGATICGMSGIERKLLIRGVKYNSQ